MKISVVVTGGTITSQQDGRGIRNSANVGEIIETILKSESDSHKKVTLNVVNPFTMLSENMIPGDWKRIAETISDEINAGADAVIVTHGTDTMPYSMNAISLLLDPLPVPVIFTGALHPIGHEESLARQSIGDAIRYARVADHSGVFLVFPDERKDRSVVHWGPMVLQMNCFQRSYSSIAGGRVATIHRGTIVYGDQPSRNKATRNVSTKVRGEFCDCVAVFRVYPGMDSAMIACAASLKKKVVILDLYHSGTACGRNGNYTRYSLLPVIRQLVDQGVLVFGTGMPGSTGEQYRSTIGLVNSGLRPLGRMSLEMATVKAMFLLGSGVRIEDLPNQMNVDLVGEMLT